MDIISLVIDFGLHIDKHLEAFVAAYGLWVYALVFVIVFAETGLVVTPFLPGDSLLFIVGALCGIGLMSCAIAVPVLLAAAISGDQCNFALGRYFGPKVLRGESSRWFNRKAFDRAHAFYGRHGGVTIVLARFMPFIRTFVPFVAGVAQMSRGRFSAFNVIGGILWVVTLCLAGYFFGNLPVVKDHLEVIIWALILVPGLVAAVGASRSSGARKELR
ncbi:MULTISPECIES: DedA family protein [unclassified Variovorax]|uniref:DedA family protein n=1 Tax=unclassified Variovorax TaxID=663243 RepID=UPI003F464318